MRGRETQRLIRFYLEDDMDAMQAKKLMEKGITCLDKGWAADAVPYFEKVRNKYGPIASVLSWLGLAIARSKEGDLRPAEMLCKEAIEQEYYNPSYYRNLAEVYLIWGKKAKAIEILRQGMKITKGDEVLIKELNKLGLRKKSAISFLSRSNILNIYCGVIRQKMAAH